MLYKEMIGAGLASSSGISSMKSINSCEIA